MKINFREFINSPGRAGQHIWEPEKPVIHNKQDISVKKHKIKPGIVPMFKGVPYSSFQVKNKKFSLE